MLQKKLYSHGLIGFKDYFKIIPLSKNATEWEIKSASRKLEKIHFDCIFMMKEVEPELKNLMSGMNFSHIGRKNLMNNIYKLQV